MINISKMYMSELLLQAAEVEQKIVAVDEMWPSIVKRIVQETMVGIRSMERGDGSK
jgi:hypothetical protein